ncbi:unnamed protein product [Amoebophrya sp. A25]|nr:unnamed protein product [Amoebophrya sp. A25]|eukprot:GSA25T00016417001.1
MSLSFLSKSAVRFEFTNIGFRWKERIVREARKARRAQIHAARDRVEQCYATAREQMLQKGRGRTDKDTETGQQRPSARKLEEEKLRETAGRYIAGRSAFGLDDFPISARGALDREKVAAAMDGSGIGTTRAHDAMDTLSDSDFKKFAKIDAELLSLQMDHTQLRWHLNRAFLPPNILTAYNKGFGECKYFVSTTSWL